MRLLLLPALPLSGRAACVAALVTRAASSESGEADEIRHTTIASTSCALNPEGHRSLGTPLAGDLPNQSPLAATAG